MATTQIPTEKKILNINEIFKDESIYPRERMDENRVELFVSLMKEGTPFPNIIIVEDESGKFILLDGFHRHSAYEKLNQNELHCDVIKADPKLWRLLSVKFNFNCSTPLKFGEIKKAIINAWLIDDIKDKQEIADMIGCTVQWVRHLTKDMDQAEENQKLELARKIKQEGNASIRDIAEKVGLSKSTVHRKLNEKVEPDETEAAYSTQTSEPSNENKSEHDDDQPKTTEPNFQNAEKIIQNFDKFNYQWEPEQKETLYAFDGIRMGWSVETISEQSGKNPNWIRSTAYAFWPFTIRIKEIQNICLP